MASKAMQATTGCLLITVSLVLALSRPALQGWFEDAEMPLLKWVVLALVWGALTTGALLIARSRSNHTETPPREGLR